MTLHKKKFINEVKSRIKNIFYSSKEGYRVLIVEKHRVEGFMQSGVFLGLISNDELYDVMQEVHMSVFDMSIEERQKINEIKWNDDQIDYGGYEIPSFLRGDKK